MADNTDMCLQPEPRPFDPELKPKHDLPLEHDLHLEHDLPLEPQAIPLVFSDSIDTSNMTNVLLIDSTLGDKQIFYDSVNTNTFPIIYDSTSKTDDLLALFRQKFPASSIQRISLAFHDRGPNIQTAFMNNSILFQESDLEVGQTCFSENLSFLISCLNEFHVSHIDFLACNTLQYSNWKSYYALLAEQTAVVVGASNDATGNMQYGGDWIMESTSEDVMNVYFNANISNYVSLLASTISQSGGTILLQMNPANGLYVQYSQNGGSSWTDIVGTSGANSWPVTFTNSTPAAGTRLTIKLVTDISMSVAYTAGTSGYFIAGSQYITFDGSSNYVRINGITSYPGFIRNGTSSGAGQANVVVRNFTTDIIGSSTLASSAGWLCQSYFARNASSNEITNCTNNGPVNGTSAGGIAGQYAGYGSGGLVTFTDCTNTGAISGNSGGGIAGAYAAFLGGSVTFTNCTNNGNISGTSGGGISGNETAYQSGASAAFTNCTNNGVISGGGAGGIAGRYAGDTNGSVTFTNCTNTGAITSTATNAGGIVGQYTGYGTGSLSTLIRCTNTGIISGTGAGGIIGRQAAISGGLVRVTNCLSTGDITGQYAGGIAGQNFAYNTTRNCVISGSYSTGAISGDRAGGIVGASVGYNFGSTPVVDISNCYSLGAISTSCGGICGGYDGSTYTNKANINISNCYSFGALTGTGAGIVAVSLTSTQINLTTPNTYVAAGSWTDSSANASGALIGTPTSINTNNPGTTWTAIGSNVPYVLSLYNAQLYSPNSATASAPYTSATSVFGSTSGYTYQLVYTSQVGSTATTRAFVYKGTAPYYNSYNFNTFAFTNTAGSTALLSSISSSNGAISYAVANPLTISADGATQSVYLRMSSDLMQYSTNNQVTWNNITIGNWPVTFINSNPTPGSSSILRVIATQALTISFAYGNTSGYFIAGSSHITFDGSGNNMNINSIISYPGLIQNGTSTANGFANVVVQNINASVTTSTLASYAGWVCQSYFGKGVSADVTNCFSTGTINAQYAGGIAGYRFGYNANNICTITGCYSTGSISGSNAGGIVGSDVGYNDNVLYTPVVNITNSYSLGTIATTCGGICGGTDAIASYINTPIITITNCYSYGTIVDANSGIVSTSYPKTTTQINVYAAQGAWSDATASGVLTGTPANLNTGNPGSTWTTIVSGTPYVLSLYNAQLYSPNSASSSSAYTSAPGLFQPGYTYQIVYSSQSTNVLTIRAFVSKGTAPYYNSYNFNTFTFTNSGGGSNTLISSITASTGVIDIAIPLTISADGATQSVYLQMIDSIMQYSIGTRTTPSTWTSIASGSFPLTFTNSNMAPSPTSILRVAATTALTISNTYGNTFGYFITGSSYITFDGSANTININSISSYPGLIQNGTSFVNGYANVDVQNINNVVSSSTLATYAGWVCQSYFGRSVNKITITGCSNTGDVNANYAGGIVGAYAGSNGGSLNVTNCFNLGSAISSFTGGIAGYRFGYNTNDTCAISGCYSTGNISGSNAGGIVGADVGFNDNALYTPVVNITNSYSLGTIATTCGGICGGTDALASYANTPSIIINNCYSSGTIVNANSGIVSTSYPKTTIQTNVYAAQGAWNIIDARANLAGAPTNFNTPGSTWTMVNPVNPYVLSLYNAQLYSPNSATSVTPYTSAGSVFGSASGYTYIIININQVANVATTKIFAYKGTITSPYAYNYNTFTLTDTNGISSPGKMSSSIVSTAGVLTITKSANNISADGLGNSINLRMSGASLQYSVVGTAPVDWTTISAWPMTITNSNSNPGPSSVLRVVATQALSISSSTGGTNGFFIAGSPYITFDGFGNTITISSISSYPGLIQNGSTTAGTNGFANVIVQNFTTAMSGSTLVSQGGWLCGQYFGRNVLENAITNCTNTAQIGSGGAGILGQYVGSFGGSLTITGCTNNGPFGQSDNTGGIASWNAGSDGGSVNFINCSNTGTGFVNYMWTGGGISSRNAAANGGSATFTNCSSTTFITQDSGGIVGSNLASNGGSATITNCFTTGSINESRAGGIVGSNAGLTNGLVTITNCFITGAIIGQFAGGIAGQSFAYNTSRNCVISQCYTTGIISGSNVGGIVGPNVGLSQNALYTASVDISNCYSLGTIASTCGGICGGWDGSTYTNKATIRISNSYSFGTLTGTGAGLVAVSLTSTQINLTTPNTYVAAGVWSDATANTNLTGTPTSIALRSGGTTWTSVSANVPYLLTSFFSLINPTQIYTPNNVISPSTTYTSSPGAYSPGIYSILSTSQPSGSTIIANVAAVAGTSPIYYGYYNNIFTWTSSTDSGLIAASTNPSSGVLAFNLTISEVCFLEGTKILCFENEQEVYRPIESLRKGDLVKTIYNGYMPICMIGTTLLYNPGNDYRIANRLYKCSKEKYPTLFEDLYITGCHSILVPWMTDDQWENTKAVNGDVFVTDNHFRLIACADEKAEPYKEEGFMNIYHIALEHDDILMNYGIYANGLLVESCSERNLMELSNMRILGQEDCAVYENVDKAPFIIRELVRTY
jgi:hypothetical protein